MTLMLILLLSMSALAQDPAATDNFKWEVEGHGGLGFFSHAGQASVIVPPRGRFLSTPGGAQPPGRILVLRRRIPYF